MDQGRYKRHERGLDFIGTEIGATNGIAKRIGVQVKFHAADNAPTDSEWMKFLAGCTLRNVSHAVFITTGRLQSKQRHDADRSGITVIEGAVNVTHVAGQYGIDPFDVNGDRDQDEEAEK